MPSEVLVLPERSAIIGDAENASAGQNRRLFFSLALEAAEKALLEATAAVVAAASATGRVVCTLALALLAALKNDMAAPQAAPRLDADFLFSSQTAVREKRSRLGGEIDAASGGRWFGGREHWGGGGEGGDLKGWLRTGAHLLDTFVRGCARYRVRGCVALLYVILVSSQTLALG